MRTELRIMKQGDRCYYDAEDIEKFLYSIMSDACEIKVYESFVARNAILNILKVLEKARQKYKYKDIDVVELKCLEIKKEQKKNELKGS